jgi:hypothetical protein
VPYKLTDAGRTKLRKPAHLNWYVRVLVGLIHTGFTPAAAARVLRVQASVVEGFWKRLLATDNPALQHALASPQSDLAAELPFRQTICCLTCNTTLTMVPCIKCSLESFDEDDFDPEAEEWGDSMEYQALPPPFSTTAMPGTEDKLAVMTERVSRGESAFHEDDLVEYADTLSVSAGDADLD